MDYLHSCSSLWCLFFLIFFGVLAERLLLTLLHTVFIFLFLDFCASTLAKRGVCVCVCSCKRLTCLWFMQRETFVCVCVCVSSCKKFVERVTKLVSIFSKASSVFWSAAKFSNFGGLVGGWVGRDSHSPGLL